MALGGGDYRGGCVGACLFCFFSYSFSFLDFDFVALSFYRFIGGLILAILRGLESASLVLFLPPASIPPPLFFVLFFAPFACVGFSSPFLFSMLIVFGLKRRDRGEWWGGG